MDKRIKAQDKKEKIHPIFQNVPIQQAINIVNEDKELQANIAQPQIQNIIHREVRKVQPIEIQPIIQKKIQPVIQKEVQPMIQKKIQPVIQKEVQPIIQREIQPVIQKEVPPIIQREIQPMINIDKKMPQKQMNRIIIEEEEDKDENDEENNGNEIIDNKCSLDEHKDIDALFYCQECKVKMCNKCEKIHSGLLKKHHIYSLDKDIKEIFTGLCTNNNHSLEL